MGAFEGTEVGLVVGNDVGAAEVGLFVGEAVVGKSVGAFVGTLVGPVGQVLVSQSELTKAEQVPRLVLLPLLGKHCLFLVQMFPFVG